MYRFKRHRSNYCRTEKNQQCIVAESYRNHQIGYESNQGLSKLGAIQKRVYADLRKGIGFEIDKDVGSIKMAEKRARTTKCCPSLISATNRFRVYAAPLISWRANSPNPIQIYCVRLRIRAHLCCTVVKNKNNFSIQRKDLRTLNSYPLLLKPLLFQDYPIY